MVETKDSPLIVVLAALTAIGTVGAVLTALALGPLRDCMRRPRLSMSYDPQSTDLAIVDSSTGKYPEVAWARMKVAAQKRRDRAEDVELLVLGARVWQDKLKQQVLEVPIEGQLLRWANTSDAPGRSLTRLTISPDSFRHVDLLSVTRDDAGDGTRRPLHIEVHPTARDKRHHIYEPHMELDLAVTARNADARRYRVQVEYDGEWGKDRQGIRQHLSIQLLPGWP